MNVSIVAIYRTMTALLLALVTAASGANPTSPSVSTQKAALSTASSAASRSAPLPASRSTQPASRSASQPASRSASQPAVTPAVAVSQILDDWHDAAARADEPRYFSHFTPDGVFLGTDATERWTAPQFRVWAHPYFQRGKAWSFKAKERKVAFSTDGKLAWFDELLDTQNMGLCRGSGVLVLTAAGWKIAQYNLSIPIPNDLADQFVKQIAGAAAPTPTPPPQAGKE